MEEVELSELMAIMRSPEKLQEVDWKCTESFTSTLPGSFSGLGRCSGSVNEVCGDKQLVYSIQEQYHLTSLEKDLQMPSDALKWP